MKPTDIYRDMLNRISLVLKERGYSRKGNIFYVRQNGNWGLIDFQKSRKSSVSETIFTINLGVCSHILAEFFKPEEVGRNPPIDACHWRQRIGMLLPNRDDKWWSITSQTSVEEFIQEIQTCLLDYGVAEIEKYIANEQLVSLWLSDQSPGLTDVQRLMNLSVLLKASGAINQCETVLHQLEKITVGKPTSFMVRQHVNSLRS